MAFNPLKNIAINLKASGSAAVIAVWIICVTLLGLFGQGEFAKSAMTILAVAGGMILIGLASKVSN
jgi:hypothetical protein